MFQSDTECGGRANFTKGKISWQLPVNFLNTFCTSIEIEVNPLKSVCRWDETPLMTLLQGKVSRRRVRSTKTQVGDKHDDKGEGEGKGIFLYSDDLVFDLGRWFIVI